MRGRGGSAQALVRVRVGALVRALVQPLTPALALLAVLQFATPGVAAAPAAAPAASSSASPSVPPGPPNPPTPTHDPRRSGFDFMTPALQAMQRDDAQNPAMLWVEDGAALWNASVASVGPGVASGATVAATSGVSGRACVACHGAASISMRGVATRYPAFDSRAGAPIDLRQRINQCRVERQHLPALAPEGKPLLSLESYVAFQSRGLPVVTPTVDARLLPALARGAALYRQRFGQLDFSCAQCHDANAGERLGGSVIPQAHPTGYPIYRLEWQGLGSVQRRLRNCMAGVRAQPFAYGAPELVELELYLRQRAAGMTLEAPAVRP